MLEKISPTDALRKMASNLDEGKDKYDGILSSAGCQWFDHVAIDRVSKNAYIKKPTRTITLELPMPLTELPKNGVKVFYIFVADSRPAIGIVVEEKHRGWLQDAVNAGRVYATREEANIVDSEINSSLSINNIVDGK